MQISEFLEKVDSQAATNLDRALHLLWFTGIEDASRGMTSKDIATELEKAGHPRQNVSRLASKLQADNRTAKDGKGGWRLRPAARRDLDQELNPLIKRRLLRESDSVLPMNLFIGTRGYLIRVADQINKSFDAGLFDCCAVMCRRLVETLIIEVYEHLGRSAEIKAPNGHYLMLAALSAFLLNDGAISLSRNGTKGLIDFKNLGDLSAHNRRFNAQASDIERIRDGLRVASEELLHIAGLRSTP